VKGTTPQERAVCYEIFERAGFEDYCAFYGTQYFTAGHGIRIDELVADLTAIATEQDPPEIQDHWTAFTTDVSQALDTVPSERSPTETTPTETEVAN
jgi:hypothetical protein